LNVLIDTPVWSAAIRRGTPRLEDSEALLELVRQGRAELIGPVRQELLSGIRQQSQFERVRAALRPFMDLPIETEDFETAAEYYNLCRSHGVQGSNTDFLLCAVASRRNLSLFTTDKDFQHFSRYLPLVFYQP
jgi:predicted nucleic acid-binding protein